MRLPGSGRSTGRIAIRDGKRVRVYRDRRTQREIERGERRVQKQRAVAAKRAKYGPTGEPAPVIVRRLGDV